MDAGPPDPQPLQPSLVQRLSAGLRPRVTGEPGSARSAVLVAMLIAAGPLLTIGGARLLAGQNRAEAARLEARLAQRLAAAEAAVAARREMAAAIGRPTLAATVDTLARVLPRDATLVRAERSREGKLVLEAATTDPDALRAALRRAPAFAGLRNVGQRQSDAALIVTFESGR